MSIYQTVIEQLSGRTHYANLFIDVHVQKLTDYKWQILNMKECTSNIHTDGLSVLQ